MHNIRRILNHAIYSDYMKLSDLREWADDIIARVSHPRAWIIEFACSKSAEDALEVLQWVDPNPVGGGEGQGGRLLLGFMVLRYRSGEIKIKELGREIAEQVDCSIVDSWSIEDVQKLFGKVFDPPYTLEAEVQKHFGSYGDIARKNYTYLRSPECLIDNMNWFAHADSL